ncbi:MAG: hypothetical protein GY838_19820 [bacterium]|nr:hypothetical protein [bacterium]
MSAKRIPYGCAVAALLLASLRLAGCGGGSPGVETGGREPEPVSWPGAGGGLVTERPGCADLEGPSLPGGDFVFALADSVRPDRAPVPRNAAERIVFAQLYETLTLTDCDGTLRPGLATHWSCTADSSVWVFALREGAMFWDGTPVTAGAVRASWCAGAVCPTGQRRLPPWSWFDPRAESVQALDARRLQITLPESHTDLPRLLAHPDLAVAAVRPGWTWPVGSGPARLRSTTPPPLPDLVCLPNPQHPEMPRWRSLVFDVRPGRDLRDLADLPADLLITRRREAVDYYRQSGGRQLVILPWDRLYLVLCPPEGKAPPGLWLRAAGRLEPQRDLTTVDAAAWPAPTLPGGEPTGCPQLSGPVAVPDRAPADSELATAILDGRTVVFDRADPGSAEIARRLAALAGTDATARGLSADDLELALSWQSTGACLLAIDPGFANPCLQLATLTGRAGWLQRLILDPPPRTARESLASAEQKDRPAGAAVDRLLRDGVLVPVAAGRRWLVIRGDLAGIRLAHDGTPLLSGLGRAGETAP